MEDLMKLEGVDRKKALQTKSISLDGGGRKTVDATTQTDKDVLDRLEERRKLEQRVSQTMIFRKVLDIDPKFCRGVNSDRYLERMRKWFYYSLIKRHNLSNRKISGAGQNLPNKWEQALVDMRGNVRARQQPEMRTDGTTRINGVRYSNFCNTDHVPVWYEYVGNYSWGKKSSRRRHVRMGGQREESIHRTTKHWEGWQKVDSFSHF